MNKIEGNLFLYLMVVVIAMLIAMLTLYMYCVVTYDKENNGGIPYGMELLDIKGHEYIRDFNNDSLIHSESCSAEHKQ